MQDHGMLPKVAAITMVYNESILLPIWARHYARQVGADYCYVVDHGSTDPIILPPGVNTIRLPRSAHNDERRAAFISTLASSLLSYYDWVLYTDVDELLLADPNEFSDLSCYCSSLKTTETVTAIGFDVQHIPDLEPPLAPDKPVGCQRGWARFTSAMCKPLLTSRPITWTPGFHCSEFPLVFDKLYLFHLHWADCSLGLDRVRKTRLMPWECHQFGGHQRVTDNAWLELFHGMANLPKRSIEDFDSERPDLQRWLQRTLESSKPGEEERFTLDLAINANELWPIPSHFRARL